MIINTNIAAMNANRIMSRNSSQNEKVIRNLSSGKKINSAADDAAGLAISEKMKSQIRGLEQATLNTQQGIDLIKTSDGAMDEIHSSLQRMRELSVQATNETNTDDDRKSIQAEITQLSKQIDSIAKNTEFNTIKAIDGSLRNISPTSAVETGKEVSGPISIHDDISATVKSSSSVDFNNLEIHNGKEAVTSVTLASPFKVASPNNGLTINYTNEKNVTTPVTLSLTNSSDIGSLASSITTQIQNTNISGRVSVSYSTNPDKITFTSNSSPDRPTSNTQIQIVGEALSGMTKNSTTGKITGDSSTKLGLTRNDQLQITFSDKTTPATRKYSEDTGFTIEDSKWTPSNNKFYIQIPNRIYTDGSDFANKLNYAIKHDAYVDSECTTKANVDYSTKVKVNFDADSYYNGFTKVYDYTKGNLQFTTVNEGAEATLQLEDINATKGSNMFSVLKLKDSTKSGLDKTDTFAIEINAKYTEKELKDEELTSEDMKKLLAGKTIYTPNGYIIEDPLNPDDYIEYTKVEGTGETVQITLNSNDYSKEAFAKEMQNAINNATSLGNHVTVEVNKNGGFDISTSQQTGVRSSIKFTELTNSPSNKSPIKTNDYELLNNFLMVTGFDYNRHVGEDGTGRLDIQVGANSNQKVLVEIGSVRAGGLGIKYIDVTTSQNASNAIDIIDKAIAKVSNERTNLGAFENSFEHVISNLENTTTNLTSAQSSIEDADMAKEIIQMSKNNILQQAAQAMLTQANQQPQQVIQLLKP